MTQADEIKTEKSQAGSDCSVTFDGAIFGDIGFLGVSLFLPFTNLASRKAENSSEDDETARD